MTLLLALQIVIIGCAIISVTVLGQMVSEIIKRNPFFKRDRGE